LPRLFLGEVLQLGNIVRGPAPECLVRHEELLLSTSKKPKSAAQRKFRAA
jgi:hypothetical protein